jgi:hypothetical protein
MADEVSQVLADLTGEEFVTAATTLFDEFRSAYTSEWTRLNENEALYQARHWENMNSTDNENDNKPVTPVIMSTVENLKADMADNYPQAIIRPEAPEDQAVAEVIGALVRQNHDSANYREEYMKSCHDMLVGGWCCEEVGYDPELNHGLGGAFIRNVDNHTVLVDPQVLDIQLGRAIFKMSPVTVEWLNQRYPSLAGQFQADSFSLEKDHELQYDNNKSILMIEVWFKQFMAEGKDGKDGHWVVHMAHIAGGQLLDDSRDEKPDGYFKLGEYPFVISTLYRRKNSPLGYGIPDYFGQAQEDSDRLDSVIMKNAAMSARNKILVNESSGFDTEDLADWSKNVHEGDNVNGITWFANPPLPSYILSQGDVIRGRVKEESGSNDFSRGNTTSGVTAASSIMALQEMANKRIRMICMTKMESYKQLVRYEIEMEREFNTLPRQLTLTIDGQQVQAEFQSSIMERQTALGNSVPIEFMISIKIEKENRWATTAQNELVLQMVQLGIIQPTQAVELMEFEGKEALLNKVATAAGPEMEQQMMAQQQAQAEQAEMEEALAQLAGNGQDADRSANQVG